MEVRSDICNPVWNVTSRGTLILILRQSADLQLLVGYFWLSINSIHKQYLCYYVNANEIL